MRRDSRPKWVVHADWGTGANKRQVARAVRRDDGTFLALAPQPFGADGHSDALSRLGIPAEDRAGGVIAGFDFTIGLPARYAAAVGITSFRHAVARFGTAEWTSFFDVACVPDEISLHRPFYPMRSGSRGEVSWAHLEAGLGIERSELTRVCEAAGGESLFWTLGGRQVGKAALHGWRTLLQPLLAGSEPSVALWPFDGTLADLAQQFAVVIAETYPAVFYKRFRFADLSPPVWSKRRGEDRRAKGSALLAAADRIPVTLDPELEALVSAGFGHQPGGEDSFDAVVGLLGMIDVIEGGGPTELFPDETVRSVEGWMLGLPVPPRT